MSKKVLPPELLFKPVSDLKLSTRARNVLKQCDIKTFGQLYLTNDQMLGETSNCGKVTLNEIKYAIEKELNTDESFNCKTNVGKLHFSPRVENCLLSVGIDTVEKLVNISIPALMDIKNLGGKSALEVILKVKELKETLSNLRECQTHQWGVRVSKENRSVYQGILINYPVEFLPIEEEILLILKREGIQTIEDLINQDENSLYLKYKGRIFDKLYFYNHSLLRQTTNDSSQVYESQNGELTYQKLPELLNALREKVVSRDSKLWSEGIFNGLSVREMEMIKLYYGFSSKKSTLQEIGDKYGLTRARIQQIIKRIKTKVLANVYFENINLLLWFHIFGFTQGGVFLQEVFFKEFNTYYKDISLNINALGEMLLDLDPMFENVSYNVWGMTILPLEHYQRVIEEGIKLLQQGPLEQEDLLNELKQRPLYFNLKNKEAPVSGVLDNFIPACLASAQSLSLTAVGSYTLESREGTKVQSIINALRGTGKPLHYLDIINKVNDSANDDNMVTVQYARAILANHKQIFARVGRGIYGLTEWGIKEYKHISDYIFEILNNSKTPLYYKQISKIVNKTHYTKEQTIYNSLTQDNRFVRTQSGYYTVSKTKKT